MGLNWSKDAARSLRRRAVKEEIEDHQQLLAARFLVKTNTESIRPASPFWKGQSDGNQISLHRWLGIRKNAARRIDPATADVRWLFGLIMDPYCVNPDLPDECRELDKVYFARAPGSNVWVSFDDLDESVRSALRQRIASILVPHNGEL
jgi:hypothetical protein